MFMIGQWLVSERIYMFILFLYFEQLRLVPTLPNTTPDCSHFNVLLFWLASHLTLVLNPNLHLLLLPLLIVKICFFIAYNNKLENRSKTPCFTGRCISKVILQLPVKWCLLHHSSNEPNLCVLAHFNWQHSFLVSALIGPHLLRFHYLRVFRTRDLR